jgi:hypothetical protein
MGRETVFVYVRPYIRDRVNLSLSAQVAAVRRGRAGEAAAPLMRGDMEVLRAGRGLGGEGCVSVQAAGPWLPRVR